jgi:hypothetical protein
MGDHTPGGINQVERHNVTVLLVKKIRTWGYIKVEFLGREEKNISNQFVLFAVGNSGYYRSYLAEGKTHCPGQGQ